MTLSEHILRFSKQAPNLKYALAVLFRALELRAEYPGITRQLLPDERMIAVHPTDQLTLRYHDYN